MKKLLIFSFLLCLSTLGYAQEIESCPGDSIVEVANGVIYFPKIDTVKAELKDYTVRITVVDKDGDPVPRATVTDIASKKEFVTDSIGYTELKIAKGGVVEVLVERTLYHKPITMSVTSQLANEDVAIQLTESIVPGVIKRNKSGESESNFSEFWIKKPAIYLYPTTQTKVNIKHSFQGTVMTTYPEYANGWEVVADPSGKLKNVADNREYNYLFWDGTYRFSDSHYNYQNGFYVKKGDYTSFLLDKLTLIGLNETEINDFIVYWLPSMNRYDEVFVHFWINDDIDNSSKLEVTPKPDTMIRVFMEFGEYKGEKKLPEQVLTPSERIGFTLLEWGGAEIMSGEVR